jgi:hypothetical protein
MTKRRTRRNRNRDSISSSRKVGVQLQESFLIEIYFVLIVIPPNADNLYDNRVEDANVSQVHNQFHESIYMYLRKEKSLDFNVKIFSPLPPGPA